MKHKDYLQGALAGQMGNKGSYMLPSHPLSLLLLLSPPPKRVAQ